MKISKFVKDAMSKFLELSIAKSAIDITKINELKEKDADFRSDRFDNLCLLSVQCYNFKNFWNLAETKQARKDAKCDVKAEDAIAYIFCYGKAYFYRLAKMGKIVVTKPKTVPTFKAWVKTQGAECVMDALTFIAFVEEGKTNVKKKTEPKPQPQQDPQNDESDVTDTPNSSSVTEQKEQIVFHLLCEGKEFIVTRHSKGGYITQTKGIEKNELKAFITKYATKDMQDLLRTYNKELAFGVMRDAKGVLQYPTAITDGQKVITQNSTACYKW